MQPGRTYASALTPQVNAVSADSDESTETGALKAGDTFQDDKGFKYTVKEGATTVALTQYSGAATAEIEIPETVENNGVSYTVVEIGANNIALWLAINDIKSVKVPASVKSIKKNAFTFTFVESVTFAEGSQLESIEDEAFYYCKLKSITIPAGVKTIGTSAFSSCPQLTSVTFADNSQLETIGASAFASTSSMKNALENIVIPASVTKIGSSAFATDNLKEVIVRGEKPATLGSNVFTSSNNLTIYVPHNQLNSYQTDWNDYASSIQANEIKVGDLSYARTSTTTANLIAYAGSAADINIPADIYADSKKYSVTDIGAEAFYNNATLKGVVIPACIRSISDGAFYYCKALTSVTFAAGSQLETIGKQAFVGTKLNSVEIPASVKSIGDGAFGYTYSLPTITFAENAQLESIGERAFEEATFTSVTLPASVTTIGNSAFLGCEKLNTITLLGSAMDGIASNCLASCKALKYIFVPKDAYTAYKNKFQGKVTDLDNKLLVGGQTIKLTDEKGLEEMGDVRFLFRANEISYTRNVTAGGYATLCLPFDWEPSQYAGVFEQVYVPKDIMIHYTANSSAEGNKANEANNTEKFILMLTKVNSTVPAGTPILVKLAEGKNQFTLTNTKDIVLGANELNPEPKNIQVVDWDGKSGLMEDNLDYTVTRGSSYTSQAANGQYTFNSDGTFGPQTSGNILPFRMFLNVSSATALARAYSISIGVNDGTTTGIKELLTAPTASQQYGLKKGVYTLDGRYVKNVEAVKNLAKGIYIVNGKKMVVK